MCVLLALILDRIPAQPSATCIVYVLAQRGLRVNGPSDLLQAATVVARRPSSGVGATAAVIPIHEVCFFFGSCI